MKSRHQALYACCLLSIGLTGSFDCQAQDPGQAFEIKSSLSELYGAETAERYRKFLDPDAGITWQVYRPAGDSVDPPGVLVYVSPTRTGDMDGRWSKILNKYNLFYIGADQSGNRKPVTRRMVLATSAIMALGQRFEIDEKRVFISGFSGGGRVASFLSSQYPTVFSGAIFICGVDFWNEDVIRDMDRVLNNRYVFLTGTRDFNRDETRIVYNKYLKAGAKNSLLEIESGMGHSLPKASTLDIALEFLVRK